MISFKHKFIFVKTKKVAGTSVSAILRQFAGPDDIVPCVTPRDEFYCLSKGWFSQNYSTNRDSEKCYSELVMSKRFDEAFKYLQENKKIFYTSHIPARKIKKIIEDKGHRWDEFYKFTIDRNPYDYMLSMSAYDNAAYNKGEEITIDYEKICKRANNFLSKANFKANQDIYYGNDELLVDKIIKYEELALELPKVFKLLGLGENRAVLPNLKVNAKHISFDDVFDQELKDRIYAKFRPTFDNLSYEK